MAAVLACGEGAVLSHRSAAELHELRATDRARIDVTVPGRGRPTANGVDVHRSTTLTPHDVTTVDGIPCTTVARTLLDLAGVVARRPLERAIEQAEVLEVLDGVDLDRPARTQPAHPRGLPPPRHARRATTTDQPRPRASSRSASSPSAGQPDCRSPSARSTSTSTTASQPSEPTSSGAQQRLIVETDGDKYHRTRARSSLIAARTSG